MENHDLSEEEEELEMLELEKERLLWREFWIHKYGYYPTRVEKVVRKVTFEEDNRESEALDKEFHEFVSNKKIGSNVNSIFR